MRRKESASARKPEAQGLMLGGLGVLAFSLTLPATKAAEPAFGAVTVGIGRAVLAAALAALVLLIRREALIVPELVPRLALVVVGVVIGFPLLTTFALRSVDSAHAAILSGLLPVATAGMAVLRAGERPRRQYWLALSAAIAAVLVFAAVQGAGRPQLADLYVLAAVVLAGLGYAEGGALARTYGGWKVICWALVLAAPVLIPVTVAGLLLHPPREVTAAAWLGLSYVAAVSMFLGFFAWYAGLARGGVARVGRLQIAQPALTLAWSALLLGEQISLATGLAAIVVLASVAVGRNARVDRDPRQPAPPVRTSRKADSVGQRWGRPSRLPRSSSAD